MIKYSDMLEEVLNLFPEEILCDDARPIGDEGMKWYSLDDLYDKIDEEHNYFQDGNELLGGLSWSVLVGITEGFRKEYVANKKIIKDKPCKKVKIRDIIDLHKTKEHFVDTINNTEEWQDYLKEIGEEIIFDD